MVLVIASCIISAALYFYSGAYNGYRSQDLLEEFTLVKDILFQQWSQGIPLNEQSTGSSSDISSQIAGDPTMLKHWISSVGSNKYVVTPFLGLMDIQAQNAAQLGLTGQVISIDIDNVPDSVCKRLVTAILQDPSVVAIGVNSSTTALVPPATWNFQQIAGSCNLGNTGGNNNFMLFFYQW
jgi:hypothetical protein